MGPQKAKLIEKQVLTENIFELKFQTLTEINIVPGQFINIKIDDNNGFPCFRAYSISSFSKDEFELCIKLVVKGRGSSFLNKLKVDDEILFIGPSGKFTLDDNTAHTFIATGSGIAPIKAMIENKIIDKNQNLNLIFGLREEKDIFYNEYFSKLEETNKNFKFFLTLSQSGNSWNGLKGRVNDVINQEKIPHFEKSSFYICGNPQMVLDIEELLLKKGIEKEKIHTEKY